MPKSFICANPECGNIVYRSPSHIARNQLNFCSNSCHQQYRSIKAKQVSTQICSLCKNAFPSTLEYFNKGGRANGLYSACKPCQKLAADDWYIDHRQEHLQQTKSYTQSHPEIRRKAVRDYRLRNPEKRKLQQRQSAQRRRLNGKARLDYLKAKENGKAAARRKRHLDKHPGIRQKYVARYVQKLKELGKSRHSVWKMNHPDSVANKNRVSTIGRQQMKANGVTAIGIYERDGGKCHLCHHKVSRKSFSLDHIIPKSKDGPGTWENLALAHLRCNVKRGVDRIPAQYRLF